MPVSFDTLPRKCRCQRPHFRVTGCPARAGSLEYARRLRQSGFDEKQAEGMTRALATAMTDTLATKQDLCELQLLLRADMAALEARLESRLTLRLGGLMLAGIGIVSALVKLL